MELFIDSKIEPCTKSNIIHTNFTIHPDLLPAAPAVLHYPRVVIARLHTYQIHAHTHLPSSSVLTVITVV